MGAIGYNKEWAASAGKEQFLQEMNEYHPGHDHEVAYDGMFPPEKIKVEKPAKNSVSK